MSSLEKEKQLKRVVVSLIHVVTFFSLEMTYGQGFICLAEKNCGLCHHGQSGGTGGWEGNIFCFVRTIKHFDSLNVKGELKARRDRGGDLVQHVTQ